MMQHGPEPVKAPSVGGTGVTLASGASTAYVEGWPRTRSPSSERSAPIRRLMLLIACLVGPLAAQQREREIAALEGKGDVRVTVTAATDEDGRGGVQVQADHPPDHVLAWFWPATIPAWADSARRVLAVRPMPPAAETVWYETGELTGLLGQAWAGQEAGPEGHSYYVYFRDRDNVNRVLFGLTGRG